MNEAILALWVGLPVFLIHSTVSLIILLVGVSIYMWTTRHDELALIRGGNNAAALSLGGAIVGLSLPLAFSLAASVSLWDLVLWGFVALILQLGAFRLADYFLKDISARIEANEIGAATFLVSIKLATAFINAAAISG
jgi:putative membrane protein